MAFCYLRRGKVQEHCHLPIFLENNKQEHDFEDHVRVFPFEYAKYGFLCTHTVIIYQHSVIYLYIEHIVLFTIIYIYSAQVQV